jgi:HAD superfamily hydrolase (TIGR01549 family)
VQLGLAFDLDGTLAHVDGWPSWLAHLRDALGVPTGLGDTFDLALEEAVRANGALRLASACLLALGRCGPDADAAGGPDLERVAAEAAEAYGARARLAPGVESLLDELDTLGVGFAIVTNGPDDMQRAVARRLGLDRRAAALIVSGSRDVGVRKPHPKCFWLACTALGVQPGDVLMVGDDLEGDVRGALRFGMTACWIAPPGAGGEAAPAGAVVVTTFAEAAQVVREFVRH